jgi:hypothetical protein
MVGRGAPLLRSGSQGASAGGDLEQRQKERKENMVGTLWGKGHSQEGP